jgi:hypothetical protein
MGFEMDRPGEAPDRERFFFIHVMKTAGTTLLEQIRSNFDADEVYPLEGVDGDMRTAYTSLDFLTSLPPDRRRRIRVFAGHFPYVATELMGGGFTTLTVLRDPVERTLSYLGTRRRKHGGTLEQIYEDPLRFPLLIRDHQAKVFSLTSADRPQSFMDVIDVDSERLALAKANLARVDVVGLQERFGEMMSELEARFGWRARGVPNRNRGGADRVPVSLRRRIAEDNRADMEFYEFALELYASRQPARGLA